MSLLNEKNLLASTVFGFDIYRHILRLRQPAVKLKLNRSGNFGPLDNPFNGNEKSLIIEIVEKKARHCDLNDPRFKGDVFDFANRHYKASSYEELYYLINQDMNLGLKTSLEEKLRLMVEPQEEFRPEVSFYNPPIGNVTPCATLSLDQVYQKIVGEEYRERTQKLRSIKDPVQAREYKKRNFPYVTFSGIFKKRHEKLLERHSGLMVLDFDELEDLEEARRNLLADQYLATELLFTSPSGRGLKMVVRCWPEEFSQKDFFMAVSRYLEYIYKLKPDASGSDVGRACFINFCENAYYRKLHGGQGAGGQEEKVQEEKTQEKGAAFLGLPQP